MSASTFRIQPAEAAVLSAAFVVLLLFFNSGHPATAILAALLFAVWIVSRAAPHFFLRGITLLRDCADTATQDDTEVFSFRARSTGGRPARFFTIEDSNSAAYPGERRPSFYVTEAAKDEGTSLRYQRALYKRGIYKIGPAVVRCGFPIGLVEIVREVANSVRTITVLPRVHELRRLPLAGLNLGQPHSFLVARGGGDQSFLGVREYRRGDSPRHIHWPSSARQGELIVKEFESERAGQLSVLLDLNIAAHVGTDRDASFEYLATIAASVCAFALQHGQRVQLLGWTGDAYQRGPASGRGALGLLLHALAALEPSGKAPFAECIQRVGARLPPNSSAVCVFSDLNPPEVWNALIALERRNIEVCAVVLRAKTFDPDAASNAYAPRSTIPSVYVSRGGDLSVHFGRL